MVANATAKPAFRRHQTEGKRTRTDGEPPRVPFRLHGTALPLCQKSGDGEPESCRPPRPPNGEKAIKEALRRNAIQIRRTVLEGTTPSEVRCTIKSPPELAISSSTIRIVRFSIQDRSFHVPDILLQQREETPGVCAVHPGMMKLK